MTLEEVIEELQNLRRYAYEPHTPKAHTALDIASEAVKRVLDVRRFPEAANWKPLPGETEE